MTWPAGWPPLPAAAPALRAGLPSDLAWPRGHRLGLTAREASGPCGPPALPVVTSLDRGFVVDAVIPDPGVLPLTRRDPGAPGPCARLRSARCRAPRAVALRALSRSARCRASRAQHRRRTDADAAAWESHRCRW